MWGKSILLNLFCFNKVKFKVKIEETSSVCSLADLFSKLYKSLTLKYCMTVEAECTWLDLFLCICNIKCHENLAHRKFSAGLFSIMLSYHKLFIISDLKVSVIKYIGKYQCLWTCTYNKCQNNPTHSSWLCQVEFLSLTGNIFIFMFAENTVFHCVAEISTK